jgi:hypothetical protein
MKKKNYLKVRFNLWTKSFHFKRFQTIMIVVCLISIVNCLQGNYASLMAIPCAALLFGGFTLFPKLLADTIDIDQSLEHKIEELKNKDYQEYINSPEYKQKIKK